jgi:hypothetical protein
MLVFAHAAHWAEAALFALPAAVVAGSIVRSLRARHRHDSQEATR